MVYLIFHNFLPFKGPVRAVSGHKIAPNHFKITYRPILALEEKKQSITHLYKMDLACISRLKQADEIRPDQHAFLPL